MKTLAFLAGVVLLLLGVAGFVPALCPNEMLFGVFAVDTPQNLFHVITGILAIVLSAAGEGPARMVFRLVGIVYALVAVMGFFAGRHGELMGMAVNMADNVLHAAIAVAGLWIGFFSGTAVLPPPGPRHDLREMI
jgi:uncharacterized protein DUF4383